MSWRLRVGTRELLDVGEKPVAVDRAVEHAGRFDAIYFPPETQHALRNSGDEPLYLLWVHEDLAQ